MSCQPFYLLFIVSYHITPTHQGLLLLSVSNLPSERAFHDENDISEEQDQLGHDNGSSEDQVLQAEGS